MVEEGERITTGKRIDYLVFAFLSGLAFLLILSIIFLASVPPVSKDALVHHLAIPKLYLKQGGIHELPFMVFSYYPMNLDLLYLIPLHFGNDIVPKFIHFSFALVTAWVIFGYLKRRTGIIFALFGVIFFLSIPIIVKLSITVYVDLGLLFFFTASLLLFLKWLERGFQVKHLIGSAAFCGLAMGTKYNGLIIFLLLTLFVPFIHSRYAQNGKRSFLRTSGYCLLFSVTALLVFSPWMIRNYIWTDNPIYPLYDRFFNPEHGLAQYSSDVFTFRSQIHHESWWEIALVPVRIFFQGQDGNPQYFDGKLNPFLLLFSLLAFYRIKADPPHIKTEKTILLAFAGLYFSFAFFGRDMRIRYISPIIPPLVLLSVFGLRRIVELGENLGIQKGQRIGMLFVVGIAAFSLCLNANYLYGQFREVEPFDFLSGAVSRDEYIGKYRFEYPVLRYINANLPEDSKILFIAMGNRGYYCDRSYVFDIKRKRSTLYQLVKRSSNPATILLGLRRMGITHLLIRYDIFDKWVATSLTKRDRAVMGEFFEKYVELLFFKWGYGVSRLENLNQSAVSY